MKSRFVVAGLSGKPFTRTSNREYTHAAVVINPAGVPVSAFSFASREELAEVKCREWERLLSNLEGFTCAVMPVEKVSQKPEAPFRNKTGPLMW